MLSFVNPPNPSCSSLEVKADEKDPCLLSPRVADPVLRFDHKAQTPKFSIRDYAIASRNKNISTSWPFPSQLLQFCLKHGIHDLLPPLETPNSVRLHCRSPSVDACHFGDILLINGGHKTIEFASCFPSEGMVVRCLNEAEDDVWGDEKPVKLTTNGGGENRSSLTNLCDTGKNPAQISEPVVEGCRLILKSGAISVSNRADEIAFTSSTDSDLMASKVCPVCKVFSSTSNTTLNAHIDQCLNILESYTDRVKDKTSKFKVKTRNKRLMEDIYAAAPHCTLEDIDRKNGTYWESKFSVMAPINELSTAAKEYDLSLVDTRVYKEGAVYVDSNGIKHRILSKFSDSSEGISKEEFRPMKNDECISLSQVDTRVHKNEGAVYIDSNGVKLRILSRFSDAPKVISKEEFRPRKNDECIGKGSKISLIGKRKHLAAKHSKNIKFKLKNRKLSSLKLFKNEIQATAEVAHEETNLQEQGTRVELSGEQKPVSYCGSVPFRMWPCSKRSDLPKKVISTHFHKCLEHPKPLSGMPISENMRTGPSTDAKTATFSISNAESIIEHSTSNAVHSNTNLKNSSQILSFDGTSTNSEHPKLSVPFRSSLKRASEDLYMLSRHEFDKSPDTNKNSTGSSLLLLKRKRLSNLTETIPITKELRKHRSLMKTTMRKVDVLSDSNSGPRKSEEASAVRFPGKMIAGQSLHPGSGKHQEANSRSSEMQIETSVLATIAFIKEPDVNSILHATVHAGYQGLALDVMTTKNLAEPMGQILHGKLQIQKLDGLECENVESQAESISAQGSSACLIIHGNMHRETSSKALSPLVTNVENKLAFSRKPSGSPSLISSISSPSPTVCHTATSDTEHKHIIQNKVWLPSPSVVVNELRHEIDVESNHQVPMDSIGSQHEQVLHLQPICCSRQRINPCPYQAFQICSSGQVFQSLKLLF